MANPFESSLNVPPTGIPAAEKGASGGVAKADWVRNVAAYGVSPSATAATNRSGFQAALDAVEAAGGGTLTFSTPGEYLLNATVFVPADTTICCAPGVILKKSTNYGEVLMNKGALTRTYDENIVLDGLTLDVTAGGTRGENIYGMMAQIGLYYVKNVTINNIRCDNVHSQLFFIQLARAEDVTINRPWIVGDKDAIHYSGHTYRVRVISPHVSNYDDGHGINAMDYPECSPEFGDIGDIEIAGGVDLEYTSAYGFAFRLLTGSWEAYANGLTYVRRGSTVGNGGRIYVCTNSAGAGPFTTANAPVHAVGQTVTGADGIAWYCQQEGTHTSANVRRITIQGFRFENPRNSTLVYGNWINDENMQSVAPGTETLSEVADITLEGCSFANSIGGSIVQGSANLKRVSFIGCSGLAQATSIFKNTDPTSNTVIATPTLITELNFAGNTLSANMSNIFDLRRANTTVKVMAAGNTSSAAASTAYQTGATTLRLVNTDIIINTTVSAGGGAVTPVEGDLIRTTTGWSQANSSSVFSPLALYTADATGTNTAGSITYVSGGRGTGSGAGGAIYFRTAPAGASGSSANSYVDRWFVSQGGTFSAASDNALNIGSSGSNRPADIFPARNIAHPVATLTYGANTTIQFSGSTGQAWQDVALTGDVTFLGANYAAGREIIVRVVSDASIRTLTFPAGWKFAGAKPADIAASKTGLLKLRSFGTGEANVVAEWSVEA